MNSDSYTGSTKRPDNDTAEGHALNRRVDVQVMGEKRASEETW